MKVDVDLKVCDLHGECSFRAPEVFTIDEEQDVLNYVAEPDPSQHDDVLDAMRACPVNAISVTDE
ncbi:MAG: ferredoxin [Thermoleophilaceae bacterium]|jgi:ferredoxin|nr:ferredoxin [Thermoleophilaceae bacterium]